MAYSGYPGSSPHVFINNWALENLDPFRPRDPLQLIIENLDFYRGDTIKYWPGPTMPMDDPNRGKVLAEIAKVFQSSNRIAECIDRHITALVGKRPIFQITTLDGEDAAGIAAADEASEALERWVNWIYELVSGQVIQASNPFVEATKNMAIAGVGFLRIWSPEKWRKSPNPIRRICLHAPYPGSVTINRDGDGLIESIEYTYTQDEKQFKEVQAIDPESGLTVFSTLDIAGEELPDQAFELDLGGRYSIYEMRSPPMITASTKRAQCAINFALTMMPRNVELSGFRERLILGAQPPGSWDAAGRFTPDTSPEKIGPGQTTYVQGSPLHDEQGLLRGYTNPSVYTSEPVNPQSLIDTAMAFVATIYHEMRQSHILGSDLELSGVSREQARSDHEAALREHADIVSGAIAGIYGSALMMIGQASVERYKNLDIAVELQVSASQPTATEMDEILKFQQAGLLSRATAMRKSGLVENVEAEEQQIKREKMEDTAIDNTSALVTSGIVSQPDGMKMLQKLGAIPDDLNIFN